MLSHNYNETYKIGPAKIEYLTHDYRLVRRNGELNLQTAIRWVQGFESDIEWRDVPTVELDEL